MSPRFSAALVLMVGLVAGAAESEEASAGGEIGGWLAVRGEEVLAASSADRLLTPASVQKLVTVAAALHHLGPEFRIETEVRGGPVADGLLDGDLVLVGNADPSWSERFYEEDPSTPLRQLAVKLANPVQGLLRVQT